MGKINTVGIIGGGVSGLAAGGLLSRKGLQVRLFEANSKIGGCCATTNLDGYCFNDGALYLALPGILDHAFETLGLDRPSHLPLRKITAPQTTMLPNDTVVTFGDGLNVSVEKSNGLVNTAVIQAELNTMMKKWEPVLRLFTESIFLHPFSLSRLLVEGWRHLPKFRGTVAKELYNLFSDDAVRAGMSGALLFNGVPPEKMPVITLLALIAMLSEGLYLPEGGMGKIPDVLSQSLVANGGEIHLNSKVDRIVVKNGRVCGLEIHGQGLIEVDAVISTVSGMLTFGSLLDSEDVPRSMKRKVEKAPLSHRVFAVQLGLSNRINAPSHSLGSVPMMEEQYKIFIPNDEMKWLAYSAPTVTMPELAPPGGSIIEAYPSIDRNFPMNAWDEKKKDAVLQSTIRALSHTYDMDIAVKRGISPQEFQNNYHLYQGAVYGLSPTANPMVQFPHNPPIRRLYQAGQTTYPGYGVGSAAMSGIFAAEALMNEETRSPAP